MKLLVKPGDASSFASLRSVLAQFRGGRGGRHDEAFSRLEQYLIEALPADVPGGGNGTRPDTHGRLMSDAVTFAIMRRISRESVYTARVIDLGARLLNALLCDVAQEQGPLTVVANDVDLVDRPSLKALARAVLLLERGTGVTWAWRSSSDPRSCDEDETSVDLSPESLYRWSRRSLLAVASAMTAPQFTQDGVCPPLEVPALASASHLEISNALVVQNYDVCFLWTGRTACSRREEDIELRRLTALAAINVGLKDAALCLLAEAEGECRLAGQRAHLCYLQGLVASKRTYDLDASDAHHRRGLLSLVNGADREADLGLEQAWLYNGLALNEAVRARRRRDEQAWHRALKLEREAFALVSGGDSAARTYLRFNLIANSAFLLEMKREYDHAIRILERAFDFGEGSPTASAAGRQAIEYRIGAVHYRAGRLVDAAMHIDAAAAGEDHPENWPERERVERALGLIALERRQLALAEDHFSRGLARCLDARSAQGTIEHARGLTATLHAAGDAKRAEAISEQLLAEEGIELGAPGIHGDGRVLQMPAPKLPAYVPEVDLEEVPSIDVNRFLAGATHAEERGPWVR